MNKFIIVAVFLFISNLCVSQSLAVKDLVAMNEMSFKDFDSFIKEQGYTWSKAKNRGQKGIAIYSWQETSNGMSSRWVIKETHSLLQNVVKFHTNRAEEYDAIKKQGKRNGFKLSSAEKMPEGGLSEIFTKNNTHLILKIRPGKRSTFYEIEVQGFK
jgi:hypothetical protein